MKTAVCYLISLGLLACGGAQGFAQKVKTTENKTNQTELATFGGGCFWCVEAVFERLEGVKSVASGYAGGQKANPTYKEVCSGDTGHAEVVQIEYDPQKVSFEALLDLFWQAHDPTTLNRFEIDTLFVVETIVTSGDSYSDTVNSIVL